MAAMFCFKNLQNNSEKLGVHPDAIEASPLVWWVENDHSKERVVLNELRMTTRKRELSQWVENDNSEERVVSMSWEQPLERESCTQWVKIHVVTCTYLAHLFFVIQEYLDITCAPSNTLMCCYSLFYPIQFIHIVSNYAWTLRHCIKAQYILDVNLPLQRHILDVIWHFFSQSLDGDIRDISVQFVWFLFVKHVSFFGFQPHSGANE